MPFLPKDEKLTLFRMLRKYTSPDLNPVNKRVHCGYPRVAGPRSTVLRLLTRDEINDMSGMMSTTLFGMRSTTLFGQQQEYTLFGQQQEYTLFGDAGSTELFGMREVHNCSGCREEVNTVRDAGSTYCSGCG